jgi:hypothetical protein
MGTFLRRSFGKAAMGALIAGETNKAALTSAAKVSVNLKLLSVILFSFPPWFSFSSV